MSDDQRIDTDYSKTEQKLLARAAAAEQRYREASAEFKRLFAVHHDLGNTTDGVVALRHAIRLQRAATRNYSNALRDLSDFVLRRGATRTGGLAGIVAGNRGVETPGGDSRSRSAHPSR